MNSLRIKLLKKEIKNIQEGKIEFGKHGFKNRKLLSETAKQVTDVAESENGIIFKIGTLELVFDKSGKIHSKGIELNSDVCFFCQNLAEFVTKYFSDLSIEKICNIAEKIRNDGYNVGQDWYKMVISKGMAEIEVNLFDTMFLASEYNPENTMYVAAETIKGEPDEDFEAEIDWLGDEINDIAYVVQVNEMI
jgi:hypothetical protein